MIVIWHHRLCASARRRCWLFETRDFRTRRSLTSSRPVSSVRRGDSTTLRQHCHWSMTGTQLVHADQSASRLMSASAAAIDMPCIDADDIVMNLGVMPSRASIRAKCSCQGFWSAAAGPLATRNERGAMVRRPAPTNICCSGGPPAACRWFNQLSTNSPNTILLA